MPRVIARRELDIGLLAAWVAASFAVALSIPLPWLRIFVDGSVLTEVKVTDLGWRCAVYLAGVAVLVVTALVAILTRGVARYVAAGVASVAAAVAIVGVGSILAYRHQITTELGVYNGSRRSIGPAPDFERITPPNGIAVAELESGGQPLALIAALVLLLVVLLALSGRHRAAVGMVFGAAMAVGAFVAPWQGAWLIEDGSARYVTFGVLEGGVSGALLLPVLVVLVAVSLRSRSRALIVVTWGVALLTYHLMSSGQRSDTPRLAWQQAIDVDEFAWQLALTAILALLGATVSRWWRLRETEAAAAMAVDPDTHPAR